MSSPQPSSALRLRAEQAIRRAEKSGGHEPVVAAIKAFHEDLSAKISGMKGEITGMKAEMTDMKAEMTGMKADIAKLLHHFGLVSCGSP